MINLLGTDNLKQLRAARINVILRGYIILTGIVILSVLGAFGIGYYLLIRDVQLAEASSARYNAEKAQYTETLKKGKAFTQNLATAKEILSSETLFSELTFKIAETLPPDTVLRSLSLSQETLTEPILLDIGTTSYDNAVRAKETFESSPFFENVSLNSTNQIISESGVSPGKYTYSASLNVTLSTLPKDGQ